MAFLYGPHAGSGPAGPGARRAVAVGARGFKLFVRALPDYPYLAGAVEGGPCPAARDLAGRMLTVTNTHWLDDAAFARLAGEICHA